MQVRMKGEKRDKQMQTNMFEPADVKIYVQNQGIVVNEKSLIAFSHEEKDGGFQIAAIGNEAAELTGNTGIKIYSPLHYGRIEDFTVAVKVFQYLMEKAMDKKHFMKPKFLIGLCIPPELGEVDCKAYLDVVFYIGTRTTVFGVKDVMILPQTLDELLNYASQEEMKKYNMIVSITKEEPLDYVKEHAREALQYAGEHGISKEKLIEIIRGMEN